MTLTPEPAGTNCAFGGAKLFDGTTTSYVCSGSPGDAGVAGANALVKEEKRYVASPECAYGGTFIFFGTDDDRDGQLDLPGEIDATSIACYAIDQDGDGANFGADNCPGVANVGQSDLDADGVGDACDATPCPGVLTLCSAICQDVQTSVTSCGQCGNACGGGANATPTCSAGTCGLSCTTGFLDCDSSATNGCEIDKLTDNNNCGACGTVCGGGTSCMQGVCSVLVRVSTTGNDGSGDGSAGAPFATVARAITAAAAVPAPARAAILVAAGTYSSTGQLTIPARTRLVGGYSAADWAVRDPAVHLTTVDATAYLAGYALRLASGGLGIDGVRVVHNGVTSDFTTNYQKSCFDLSQASGSSLVDSACLIASCGFNDSCYGVNAGSGARVEHNVVRILAGSGTNSSASAIFVQGGGIILVARNEITNTYSGRYNYGLKVSSSGSAATLLIENNVINANSNFGGNGGSTVEVGTLPSGSTITVRNNTIRGGTANAASFNFWTLAINAQTGNTVRVENNILFSINGAVSSNGCLKVPATFTSLANNDLFDCGGALVNDGTARATLADVNALPNASANLNFDLAVGTNAYFVNEASNFALTTGGTGTFLTVKRGALDLSPALTVDLTGAARTGSAGLGWSMGAFEQDL